MDQMDSHTAAVPLENETSASQPETDPKIQNYQPDVRVSAYSSYTEYIGDIRKNWPQYRNLYSTLTNEHSSIGAFKILIADSEQGIIHHTSFETDLAVISSTSESLIDNDLNLRVISCLRMPPKVSVQVRIICLQIYKPSQTSSRSILDTLGLLYDIDPIVFDAFFSYCHEHSEHSPEEIRTSLPRIQGFLRLHGRMVTKVLDQHHPSGELFKVVLVLSYMSDWNPVVHGVLFDEPPTIYRHIQEPISRTSTSHDRNGNGLFVWHTSIYGNMLSKMSNDKVHLGLANRFPLEFSYPWIVFGVYDIMSEAHRLRFGLTTKTGGWADLDETWDRFIFWKANKLTRDLSGVRELLRELKKITAGNSTGSQKSLLDLKELISEALEDAYDVLNLASDMKQTAIGTMAIQESRKSIQEAISVKRLTQLAFVFIPLSYVSSLFGMNINEMTGNGPRLWKFVATSFALLIGVLAIWSLSEMMQKLWDRRIKARKSDLDFAFEEVS